MLLVTWRPCLQQIWAALSVAGLSTNCPTNITRVKQVRSALLCFIACLQETNMGEFSDVQSPGLFKHRRSDRYDLGRLPICPWWLPADQWASRVVATSSAHVVRGAVCCSNARWNHNDFTHDHMCVYIYIYTHTHFSLSLYIYIYIYE